MISDTERLHRDMLIIRTQNLIKAAAQKIGGFGHMKVSDSPAFKIFDKEKNTEKLFKILEIHVYYSEMYKCERISFSCINIANHENVWHYKDEEIFYFEGAGEWIESQLGI